MFHATQYDDKTIARDITSQDINTTSNQVKEIRLAHGWWRRAYDDEQLAKNKAETFALVRKALEIGSTSWNYGGGQVHDQGQVHGHVFVLLAYLC